MTKKQTKHVRITCVQQLKKLAQRDCGLDCFILLYAGLRSSKYIEYYPDDKSFYILNFIDGSEQQLTENQILDSTFTNIGEAMKNGTLIMN